MEIICTEDSPLRLDNFLAHALKITRSQALGLIQKQCVRLNATLPRKSGAIVQKGDIVVITPITESPAPAPKSDIEIERIYEDSDILVINKPPHLATHGAPNLKEESLTDWLKSHKIALSNISGETRAGIVHRLDKETSGAMVVAKNNATHLALSHQLQAREMGRIYIAIIDMPLKDDIVIECFLARNPKNRLKISKIPHSARDEIPQRLRKDSAGFQKIPPITREIPRDSANISPSEIPQDSATIPRKIQGRWAKSAFYKLLQSYDMRKELIAAKLFTGRTHQIRAHLESVNRHILGDELYGYKGAKMRVMLHSYILHLNHPKLGAMAFVADMFSDMKDILEKNFDMEKVNENLAHLYSRFGV